MSIKLPAPIAAFFDAESRNDGDALSRVFAEDGVVLDEGPDRVVLDDIKLDVPNARKLAAAILECCDRIEGVGTADTVGDVQ